MSRRSKSLNRSGNLKSSGAARARRSLHFPARSRQKGCAERRTAFVAPEDWHSPGSTGCRDFRIVVQPPGCGLRHVVTPEQIRARLAQLPEWMLEPLEVVQLSRVTRKKRLFPCYGMQWGSALYLYPVASELVEQLDRPPKPAQQIEAAMYGGRWEARTDGTWLLYWSEAAIQDYYLNNILIHELGHLWDDRNRSSADRERYAEWFAIRYGYRPTRSARRAVRRRHHASRRPKSSPCGDVAKLT